MAKHRFIRGLKVGLVVGAAAGVLSNKENRHEIAKKLNALQVELEKELARYREQWPEMRKALSSEGKKLAATAATLKKDLASHAKTYERTGEKVKSQVATDTRKLVNQVGSVIKTLKVETARNAQTAARPVQKTVRRAKTAVKKTVKKAAKARRK